MGVMDDCYLTVFKNDCLKDSNITILSMERIYLGNDFYDFFFVFLLLSDLPFTGIIIIYYFKCITLYIF